MELAGISLSVIRLRSEECIDRGSLDGSEQGGETLGGALVLRRARLGKMLIEDRENERMERGKICAQL
jgi:hypothetical protein